MTKREYNRRCASWMRAYLTALFEGREVHVFPSKYQRQGVLL